MSSYGHDHTFLSASSSASGIRRRPEGRARPGRLERFLIALVNRLQSAVYGVLRAAVQRFMAFYADIKCIDYTDAIASMPERREDSGIGERQSSLVQRAGFDEIFEVRLPEPSEIAIYKQWQLAPIRLAKRAAVKRNFSTLQSKWRTPAKTSKEKDLEARRGREEAARPRQKCHPSSSTPCPDDAGHCGRLDGAPLYNAFSSSFVQGAADSLLPRTPNLSNGGNECFFQCSGQQGPRGASFDLDDSDLEEGETEDDDELDSILSSTIAPSTTATSSNVDMEKRLAELEAKLAVLIGSQQPHVTPPEVAGGNKLGECYGKKETKNAPVVPTAPPLPPPGLLLKSKGAMLPPPPPPLPPIPPKSISDTRPALAQQASINQGETSKVELSQLSSTSISASSKPKTMAMTDVLRDLSSAMNRLRKVERSPGGTPMTASKSAKSRQSIGGRAAQPMPKPRLFQRKLFGIDSAATSTLAEEQGEGKENDAEIEPAEEIEKLSPYDFMCQALARKFENTHLNEDEEEEDDEARENEGVSRRVSHLRDSSWADDSWRDSIGATPKK